ncbi:2988_t:CDS:2 [Ambispora gerdemannii]|uniref:2988_t:CDS:1 n=1 Tax=Ambispora gerdemannii TaxID=144530 RepID=A0A9N8W0G8_9GLOM|nr:2988_t:CDS:2 [Ambispora gerdemannii]
MVKAQEYIKNIKKSFPNFNQQNMKKLVINDKELEGYLDLTDFVNLEELDCSNNLLTNLNLSQCTKLKKLKCDYNQLTELDLVGLEELEEINCSNNYLPDLIYFPSNPNKLIFLDVSNNNFPKQDLSFFSQFTSLNYLDFSNNSEKRIQARVYNRFCGSLEPLQNLKLKKLSISNTDLDAGLEYLPADLKLIRCAVGSSNQKNLKELLAGQEIRVLQEEISKLKQAMELTRKRNEIKELSNKLPKYYKGVLDRFLKYQREEDQQELLKARIMTATEINNAYLLQIEEVVKKIVTWEITEPLEGGELDLREFKNLEAVTINNLTTPLTKIEVDGLTNLKELVLPDKPKEESAEDKKLYAELGISEDKQKQLIKEIERLTGLFTTDKKINLIYATEKTPHEQLKDHPGTLEKKDDSFDLYLQLPRTDKAGNFCPNLDNLTQEYQKEFELLLTPATFPYELLEIGELLTIYFPKAEDIPDKLIELTSQEVKKNLGEEELKKLAIKATIDGSADQQYTILVNYHFQNPGQEKIKELITTTPLKLEIEHLKQKQEQLPSSENFEKLTKQKRELENKYIDKNFTDKSITKIIVNSYYSDSKGLFGDLIIQAYPNLEEISLPNQELTTLTIINCPNLKQLNVRQNKLTKLEITRAKIDSQNEPIANEIKEIMAGQNELTVLDLTNCQKIKKLIIPDNPTLAEVKGLNLAVINDINITNAQISLSEENEELKAENKRLYQALRR